VTLELVAATEPLAEPALIAACLRGDRTAERTLFRREYPRVNATIYRILGSTRDTDDLVQETFIAVFRGLAQFRGDARLSTWIDRIAVRVVYQHLAARKRIPIPLELVDELADPGGALDDQALARDGLRRLYEVLGKLKPDARTAFALFAIDGRTIAEVAEITGTSVVTAKLRIWRARRDVEARAARDPALAAYLGKQEAR
jgi:RNA polymerase sigma-70 factor (ECF subfamily)